MDKPQNLANHVRFDPPFHFLMVPVAAITVIMVGYYLVRFPHWLGAWLFVVSLAAMVGLRFASDEELPALVQRALDEKLSTTDIKKAIVNWRPDYSRI